MRWAFALLALAGCDWLGGGTRAEIERLSSKVEHLERLVSALEHRLHDAEEDCEKVPGIESDLDDLREALER